MTRSTTINGPILSVANLADHEGFFINSLGMTACGRASYCEDQVGAMFGVHGVSLETVFLRQSPTDFGVRLWCFDPPHQSTVRDPEQGTDLDALKVIDFYASDFEGTLAKLAAADVHPKSEIAEYELPEGQFREAHFWRPDNVVCAIISGPAQFFAGFASLLDATVSEPQSISAPVSDAGKVIDFYEQVFGMGPLYRYQFTDPSFDALVGTEQEINLTAVNVGVALREPYLGIIDYGDSASGHCPPRHSLAGYSRPPRRGLIGIEVQVPSVAKIVTAARSAEQTTILTKPQVASYPPIGTIISCLIEGPHGVIHHVIQEARVSAGLKTGIGGKTAKQPESSR